LATWLSEYRFELHLSQEEISLFSEFAKGSKPQIEAMRFLYLHKSEKNKANPSIYSVDRRRDEIGGALTTAQTLELLSESQVFDPLDHYLDTFKIDANSAQEDYGKFSVDGLDHRSNFLFLKTLKERVELRQRTSCVTNFAGYLTAPSGMGESARSMRRTLAHSGVTVREMALPHVRSEHEH